MHRIIEFSLNNRFLVIVMLLILIAAGLHAMLNLPIDAVPDVTPNQVQILTKSPGLGPVEVEQFITFPVETSISGLPGIESIRSVSRFGLSSVYVFFREDMDIYFCRRLVMERLPQAREAIPAGYGTPELGPISTGLGEIYQFEVQGQGYSLMELRSILDWDIAFKLRSVPGVVEVNSYGGELKTYEVQIDPDKLVAFNIPVRRVFEALEANNANAGGAYIIRNQEQYLVRGEGLMENLEQIGQIVLDVDEDGTPILVRNVAAVKLAPMVRQGAVTRDGNGEAVTGVVMMLIGENSRVVVDRVRAKLEEIKKALPPGVTVDPYYDRTSLVRKTIRTVITNLSEGGALVIVVLLVLLGSFRGGLIVASAIPVSMLFAFIGMRQFGLSGNLLSLGAIDFGLIVDGSVVMVENIVRHLSKPALGGETRLESIREASREVARPVTFAVGIIIIVYLPILTLQGVEGKMFRPMALTVVFALAGSLILALTLMPVAASLAFRKRLKQKETWILRQVKRLYAPALRWTIGHPRTTVLAALLVFASSLALVPFMGGEFIPKLDEGDIAVQAWRLPSVALEESVKSTTMIEKVLMGRFPEVATVVSRTGQAEIATDPMGVETSDIYVILKPPSEWRSAQSKEELIALMDAALRAAVPGNIFSYSQPIELRVQELIAGVRSEVAIKIFGQDLEELKRLGDEVVWLVSRVPGAAEVKAEQVAGLPYLRIKIDQRAIARYGINISEVLDVVRAVGGRIVGQIMEGQKRFFFQVRFQQESRDDLQSISNLKIADSRGRLIPLGQLATLTTEEGPAQISREDIHRRLAVEANFRGRDLAGFVADAQEAVEALDLPPGYWIEWGGQFENLQRASRRLMIVVPVALFLIFVLLYSTFGSASLGFLIFINVPIAATGGIVALFLRGLPFSISAGVGFIALFGVAVLNGVVLVSYIRQRSLEGASSQAAAYKGALVRLRPVLMTALVASLGFVPMALASSAGAEVQRPLATVVIGGLMTSTALTLLVLPAIYGWFDKSRPQSG